MMLPSLLGAADTSLPALDRRHPRRWDGGMAWDPTQYTKFISQRERPFHELLARVGATAPGTVLDVGCGPGTATATLLQRWPSATVTGLDSSEEMIRSARPLVRSTPAGGRLEFSVEDAHDVDVAPADVVVSNAMLQWIPDHRELLDHWADDLRSGAWLAFQVPGNFDAPSHRLMRETADDGPWATALHGVLRGPESVDTPAGYASALMDSGLRVDAWESTYLQWLTGPDPVLEWVRGTGLRPALAALEERAPDLLDSYVETYTQRLREAYPSRSIGAGDERQELTALPFRRIFVVATKP
ncbi:MAG: methyltransferase domain-containing protein [Galactobacter sp.]